jgi:ubiquinol-cytochrome c reductase cytochrome b subunit
VYDGHDGLGLALTNSSAPDLKGFASREWIAGLLDPAKVSSSNYFGGTKFADGKMAKWVKKSVPKASPEKMRQVIAAVSAEAQLKSQRDIDTRDASLIAAGRDLIVGDDINCTECHQFRKPDEEASAPDLTGYGSRQWMIDFINNPAHARFYGKRNDRMPAFGAEKMLDPKSIEMVVDWLRGEWFEPQEQVATNR